MAAERLLRVVEDIFLWPHLSLHMTLLDTTMWNITSDKMYVRSPYLSKPEMFCTMQSKMVHNPITKYYTHTPC